MTHPNTPVRRRRAGVGLLLLAALSLSACREKRDDANSEAACTSYCDKKYACNEYEPTDLELDGCISECGTSIANNCGNVAQAEANAIIESCVDLACDDFWPCLVFDEAPECFDFVDED